MRQLLIAGNWKSNGSLSQLGQFASQLEIDGASGAEVWLFPPTLYVAAAKQALPAQVRVGVQNCSEYPEGAYTGEVTPEMIADVGGQGGIVGHSERRQLFGEGDVQAARKVARLVERGLLAVLCVGETLQQREAGDAERIVLDQVRKGLAEVGDLKCVVVAYEPVWAIGTGRSATSEDAQTMHAAIRRAVRERFEGEADALRILYGGSVKPENAAELFRQPDIDGALVGGASLSATDFSRIIKAG